MSNKYLMPINLNQNELQNALIQNLATAPTSPKPGQIYFDTGLSNYYGWNGSVWLNLGQIPPTITITGDATGSGTTSIALTFPNIVVAGTYPKITYNAKGQVTAGGVLVVADIPTLTHIAISDFDTQVRLSSLNQMAAPTASVSMNSKTITNVADPVNPQDAVTKTYADNLRAGLIMKDPVKAASTANVVIATGGLVVVDGYQTVAGDRILLKSQTTGTENGIYIVATGAWVRSSDADNSPSGELREGMTVWVDNGTTNANTRLVQTTTDPIVLGTSVLTFTKDFQSADFTASGGITRTGNVFSLTIGVVTAGTYSKVTVDNTGRVIASASMTLADITTALGYIPTKKFAMNVGDGTSTSININHALNTTDLEVSLKEIATNNFVMTDIATVDANNLTLTFAIAPTSAQYRVVVIG